MVEPSGASLGSLFEENADLPAEVEEGHLEYKRKMIDPTPARFERLVCD